MFEFGGDNVELPWIGVKEFGVDRVGFGMGLLGEFCWDSDVVGLGGWFWPRGVGTTCVDGVEDPIQGRRGIGDVHGIKDCASLAGRGAHLDESCMIGTSNRTGEVTGVVGDQELNVVELTRGKADSHDAKGKIDSSKVT